MELSDRIARIEAMEERLNAALAAVRAMDEALDGYARAQEDIDALASYLASEEWREDLAADEEGLLPDTLRRGVLSEDGIYDLLEENDELRQRFAQF